MAFKRTGNSRDDRSSTSSNRNSNNGGDNKKTFSSGKRTSTGGGRSAGEGSARNSGSSFKGGAKPFASSGSKPFSKRASSDERPERTFKEESSGEKKTYTSGKSKPYTGRPAADGPKRTFNKDTQGGERKTFSQDKGRPYTGRPVSEERTKRSFGNDAGGEKKSFSSSRSKPYSGRTTGDDRPKGNFSSEEKRSSFRPSGDREQNGERKYKPRPTLGGFQKRDSASGDQPYHKREESSREPFTGGERSATTGKTMRSRKAKPVSVDNGEIRLNRYISNAGICSRRKADELIAAGVISVNGEVVSELGSKVNPMKDVIRYNGETLKREKMVYVLLNKPKDYITTTDDPHERRTVMQLVEKASRERIYPIGRLDRNTTGLLLMTNDGDLADKLSHPKNNVVKLYHAELNKSLTQGDLNKIGFGVELEDGLIKPDMVSYVQGATKKEIGIQIHSGKNRIVRRIFESLGYEVVKLDRVVYANLTKKDLPRGRWRYLTEEEVIQLKHLI
jgi:23S rRNA pseudouridine2605 synthase